jgi:O-antigen ligase
VFSALFAGFLVAVLVLENSLRSFEAPITSRSAKRSSKIWTGAAATLIPATIATVILVIFYLRTRSRSRWLALAALALMAAIFVVTLTVNLPINGDQLDWSAHAPPADWADVRDRWQIGHAVRTVAAGVAFGLLAMAASARPRVPAQTRRTG